MARSASRASDWGVGGQVGSIVGHVRKLLLFSGLAHSAFGAPLLFDLPVRCQMGRDCFIQNYFDHDAGPGSQDYRCGHLTYDNHTGTDFRVRDLPAMQTGVSVIAAAAGVVSAVRDGEPDIPVRLRGRENLHGKDAGNGVVLDHGGGWVTQYSHLRRASVKVKVGQQVAKGEALGLIGESGNADFPHVDFTIRQHGDAIDPFSGDQTSECGQSSSSLWSEQSLSSLSYQPTGVLIAGFSASTPERSDAEMGNYRAEILPVLGEVIAFWVEFFGANQDDRWMIEILDPAMHVLARSNGEILSNKAVSFIAAWKKRGQMPWSPGNYSASFRLYRSGKPLIEERREIIVR